jgi:uncharacterized protein (DUF1800 family)
MGADWAGTARLLRRTGFGTTGAAVDAALAGGAASYVARLLADDPAADTGAVTTPVPTFDRIEPAGRSATKQQRAHRNKQVGSQLMALTAWWVRRMVAVEQPFGEKLTFCWHNHFATAATKVRDANSLAAQNATLRRLGRGDFRTLALAMLTDAAMLRWLDGELNTAGAANENLSREFMELFALGHGNGYTETDVREGARALTGWKIRADGSTFLNPRQHDSGSKTLLGVTGNLDQSGYCDAVLSQPDSPRYLATRWWGQLVSDTAPSAGLVDRLATAYGPGRSMTRLLTGMLTAPEFATAQGSIVIDPVEWLIGTVRALKVPVTDDDRARKLIVVLRALGQLPFYPPNVSGWPSGQAWLSTAAADLRMQIAAALVSGGDISVVTDAGPSSRLAATAHLLGIASWSAGTAATLRGAAGNPVQLVTVALNTPEYLTN